jgi:hypothetical protein
VVIDTVSNYKTIDLRQCEYVVIQKRVEQSFFKVLNHANFGMPNGPVSSGAMNDATAYSEVPSSTLGQVSNNGHSAANSVCVKCHLLITGGHFETESQRRQQ